MFNLFAEVFHWALKDKLRELGLPAAVIHYLDDFFLVLPQGSKPASNTKIFHSLCQEVGLSIKDSKSEQGSIASFTGIEIDTGLMVIRLQTSKLHKARKIVQAAVQERSLSLRQLQQINGYLNFVSTVVPLGHTFLRRLYDMELFFPPGDGNQRRRISSEGWRDLAWWAEVLSGTPERSITTRDRETILAWTDAASSKGLGAFYISTTQPTVQPSSAFSLALPTTLTQAKHHINYLEMQAVEQTILYWGHAWYGKKVVIHIDNRAVAYGLANGTMRGTSMEALRGCWLLATEYDLEIEPLWISTKDNNLADALSRLDIRRIADLAPQLIYPPCDLQKHGLLTFSNLDYHRPQPTISGKDSPQPHAAITTPPGLASHSSAHSLTTGTRVEDVSQQEPHGLSSGSVLWLER